MKQSSEGKTLDVLAFGAHPDDVKLTCAGTLIKLARQGYRTGVVALTAGELGTRGDAAVRAGEFAEAARIMQVSEQRILGLPDGGLAATTSQKLAVIGIIREFRPRIVLAPYWKDRHPDHSNGGRLVQEAGFLAGLRKIETGRDAFRPNRILFYASRYEFRPSFIVDVSQTHQQKLEAVRAYRSQFFESPAGEPEQDRTNVSRPGFLEAVIARARQYGSYIGVEYGEPFLVREPLRLDDPVAFFGPEYLESFL
ncbi:MAG: bacillithiol biosynthesis deacetylase BshB1 [Acidobacteriota bacterium]